MLDLSRAPSFPAEDTGGRRLPWWLKLVAKGVLTRLPVPYDFWRRLNVFRHGTMDDLDMRNAWPKRISAEPIASSSLALPR